MNRVIEDIQTLHRERDGRCRWDDDDWPCHTATALAQLAERDAQLQSAVEAGRAAAVEQHDAYLELADTLAAVRHDHERAMDQRDQLRDANEAMRGVVLAAQRWYRDFTDREAWIATGEALSALDQAQPHAVPEAGRQEVGG